MDWSRHRERGQGEQKALYLLCRQVQVFVNALVGVFIGSRKEYSWTTLTGNAFIKI
jgi:hypothetical protein